MSNTSASLERLRELSAAISSAVESYDPTVPEEVANSIRVKIAETASELVSETQDPLQRLFVISHQLAQNLAIRAGIEIGLFDKFSDDGEALTLHGLGEKTGVDSALLVRLIRMLTATGLTVETGVHQYVLSRLGKYLRVPEYQSIFVFAYDTHFPSMVKIPDFLTTTGWKNPDDALHSSFQLGHQTGHTFFSFLAENPNQLRHFNAALTVLGDFGVYKAVLETPWSEVVGQIEPHETALVDVGGADGHVLQVILEKYPEISGEFILQDLPDTLAKVPTDLNKRIKVMPHDFFTVQPVKGARVYHYRMVFHDWPLEDCRRILRNLRPSMRPGYSKLLIGDFIVPEIGASMHQALVDLTMMTIGAEEKSETQFRELLESEGFRIRKIWRGRNAVDSIIESEVVD